MDKSEQWNLNGDCSMCRRRNYCSHPCTKNKRYNQAVLSALVTSTVDRYTGGAYSETLSRLANGRVEA